jgi:hypothetical protein
MRTRNPWVRFLLTLCGWKVLFMGKFSEVRAPAGAGSRLRRPSWQGGRGEGKYVENFLKSRQNKVEQ